MYQGLILIINQCHRHQKIDLIPSNPSFQHSIIPVTHNIQLVNTHFIMTLCINTHFPVPKAFQPAADYNKYKGLFLANFPVPLLKAMAPFVELGLNIIFAEFI